METKHKESLIYGFKKLRHWTKGKFKGKNRLLLMGEGIQSGEMYKKELTLWGMSFFYKYKDFASFKGRKFLCNKSVRWKQCIMIKLYI